MNEQAGRSESIQATVAPKVDSTTMGLELPKKRKRRPPPMSEIAKVRYRSAQIEVQRRVEKRTLVKERGFFALDPKYQITYETVTETVDGPGFEFWVQGLGSNGYYTVGKSKPFDGTERTLYRSRFNSISYIKDDDVSRKAFDELIADLWRQGWQPTSLTDIWHDIRLRRVVVEPRRKKRQD